MDELTRPWRATIPIGFVVVSLIAMILVPMLVADRTGALRAERADLIEPARELVDRIEAALAQGVAARRGLLLTGDSIFLARYRTALAREEEAQTALEPLARQLGPEVVRRADDLRRLSDYWHGSEEDLLRRLSPAEQGESVPAQQALYERTLEAAERLRDAVLEAQASQRRAIARIERLGSIATALLVFVSLAALVLLGRVGRRLYDQAGFERRMRRLGQALSGSVDLADVAARLTEAASKLSGADGAYFELRSPQDGGVDVLAASGTMSPLLGTRLPSPGSFDAATPGWTGPVPVRAAELEGPAARRLAALCPGGRAVVAPLAHGEERPGTLVVVRRRGRFGRATAGRLALLQDMASLAVRRAVLFEEAAARRREAEELLQVKARLIRGISHDLKNPLGAADGYAQLLESGMAGDLSERQREYVIRIRRIGRSMQSIIEDLLRFSDPAVGELEVRLEPVDVGRVVRETAEDYRAASDAAGLELEVDVPDDPRLRIRTDERRVGEILANLLSNALKFTPSGGRITVRAMPPTGDRPLAVEVEDTGPGVPEGERERVFEEYARLDPDRTSGTGLGLAISRNIARMLGGDLTVDAPAGGGARFALVLPDAGLDAPEG